MVRGKSSDSQYQVSAVPSFPMRVTRLGIIHRRMALDLALTCARSCGAQGKTNDAVGKVLSGVDPLQLPASIQEFHTGSTLQGSAVIAAKRKPTPSKRAERRKQEKLPLTFPNGTKLKAHPLVWGYERYSKEHPDTTLRTFAAELGVTRQSLHILLTAARRNRHFLTPAERVPKLSQLLDIPPYMFRPALWQPGMVWQKERAARRSNPLQEAGRDGRSPLRHATSLKRSRNDAQQMSD